MSTSSSDSNSRATLYRRRQAEFGQRRVRAERRASQISHARVAAFLAAVVCFLAGMLDASSNIPWFAAGAILSAGPPSDVV